MSKRLNYALNFGFFAAIAIMIGAGIGASLVFCVNTWQAQRQKAWINSPEYKAYQERLRIRDLHLPQRKYQMGDQTPGAFSNQVYARVRANPLCSLRELATNGALKRTGRVWCPGMKEWQRGESVLLN
jgi:hypothetical protein